jgi:molybdate transport system substrate-binding protein
MAEIKVLTPGMFRGVFPILIPEFERASGHKVALTTVTPGIVRRKLLEGESPDVAFAVDHQMQELKQAGKVVTNGCTEIGRVFVAAAIRTGAPKLDLSTPDAVKRAIRAARSVAINDPKGGSNIGRYMMDLADRFAFDDELRSRFKLIPGSGDKTSEAVARGDADFGFTISSEIIVVRGAEISGPLPPEMNSTFVTYGFLVPGTQKAEAGMAFVNFMVSSMTKAMLRTQGIEPS